MAAPFYPGKSLTNQIVSGYNSAAMQNESTWTAFADFRLVASGSIPTVAAAIKEMLERDDVTAVLVFDDETCRQVELDLRGSPADVVRRIREANDVGTAAATPVPRSPGRPKLGVVSREVTLLPRHWEWLNRQPGGASVALRKLVDERRRSSGGRDRVRHAQEIAYRFMTAIAGNLAHYEEATRALFAADRARFDAQIESWPADIRVHTQRLAENAFSDPSV